VWLFIGLGNPGEEYAQTRHNVGFQCVAAYARRHRLEFSDKRAHARVAEGNVAGQRIALAKPFTYMNLSGQAVVGLRHWYKLEAERDLVVIYDDIDLPFGTLRLRERGSAGTHNGMRSIIGQLGHQDFRRIRVGISAPPKGWELSNYVLGRFTRDEQELIPALCERVADAIDVIVREGFTTAMNRFNGAEEPRPKIQDPRTE
jgi:PTH1 family peptidyl-tRNA hydrolase